MPAPERSDRVTEIVRAALERPTGERAAFLDTACAGDDGLRREAEGRLRGELTSAEYPRSSAATSSTGGGRRPDATLPLGAGGARHSQIGPYRILDVLGEGGMGTVYLAEQTEPMRREVAVKVIRATLADRRLAHRFEAERQALARMNHPNIAQVYDAGDTEEGEPYLVMELVPGLPINTFCDQHRLGLEERIELFIATCEGVHHAHQKGVLHRDLKPSNILVSRTQGKGPVPKIIDFGIAKALDRPLVDATLTEAGVLGTPAYLSPEALESAVGGGDIDIRADVYALGVVLFELLVGVQPFKRRGESFFTMLERLRSEDAPAPSQHFRGLADELRGEAAAARRTTPAALGRVLRGDLDWITLRAVARERDRRYASAAGLGADLRRHLDHLPVTAGAPGRLYRTAKFVRRHWVGVAASIVVVVALALGLVARTLEAQRANREAAAARRAQAETTEVVDFLIRLFEVADPNQSRGETVTARELLDRGAERVREELASQPLTRARMLDAIGRVYENLGLYDAAAPALEEALRLREESLPGSSVELGTSLNHLGHLHWLEGRYEEAEARLEQALAIHERLEPADPLALAGVLDNLGSVYDILGRFPEAEAALERALELRTASLGENDVAVAASLDDLAVLLLDQHRYADAEPLFLRALAIREEAYGNEHLEVATTLNGLALAVRLQGRFEESNELHRRALAIRERLLPPDHPELGQTLFNLGTNLLGNEEGRGRDIAAAEPMLRRAAEIWERSLGADHPRYAYALYSLAELNEGEGRLEEAEELYRRVAELFEETLGPTNPMLGYPLKALADLCRQEGRNEEAESLYRRALQVRSDALPADSQPVTSTLEALAELLESTGRSEEAASLLARLPDSAD